MNTNLKLKSYHKKLLLNNLTNIIPSPYTTKLNNKINEFKDYVENNINEFILEYFPEDDMVIANQYCSALGDMRGRSIKDEAPLDYFLMFDIYSSTMLPSTRNILNGALNKIKEIKIQLPYQLCLSRRVIYQTKEKNDTTINKIILETYNRYLASIFEKTIKIDFYLENDITNVKFETNYLNSLFVKDVYNLLIDLINIYKNHLEFTYKISGSVSDLIKNSKNMSDIYSEFPELKTQIISIFSNPTFNCDALDDEALKDILEISEKYI